MRLVLLVAAVALAVILLGLVRSRHGVEVWHAAADQPA